MLQTQKNQLPVQVIIQDRDQSYTLGNKDIETLEDSGSNDLNLKGTARDLLQSVRRKLEFNEVDDPSFLLSQAEQTNHQRDHSMGCCHQRLDSVRQA